MKIGVIGAGNVGGALARRWDLNGHDILLGVRDLNKPALQMLLKVTSIKAGTIAEAVAFGEVVVIATPAAAVDGVIAAGGDWSGKIVIDTMNRLGPAPADTTGSVAGDLARLIPQAKVVKAFNSLGAELLLNPTFGAEMVSLFICGDDDAAKETVARLAEEISYDVVDCGPLASAVHLEHMAKLWIFLARRDQNRDFAFKLMRR